MRFYLDHDMPVRLARVLRELGHEAWTTTDARLETAADSEQAIYAAEKNAVLITCDVAFKNKMVAQASCQMLFLRNESLDGQAHLIKAHIVDVCGFFKNGDPGVCELGGDGVKVHRSWEMDAPENP